MTLAYLRHLRHVYIMAQGKRRSEVFRRVLVFARMHFYTRMKLELPLYVYTLT